MTTLFLAPDNSTRFIFTLSQHSAWVLLHAYAEKVEERSDELSYKTAITELQHLYGWFKENCDYEDWQDEFREIDKKIDFIGGFKDD